VPFLVALLTTAVWVACFYFPVVWMLTGIGQADKLFLDMRNLLSAGEAARHGLDPYISNPLDPYHRLHGYTDWWLVTGTIGLTLEDTAWLGTLLLGLTLASAVLLLRPANWSQGRVLLLLLVSPPLLFAINRANHDLVVFVIMCGALACLRRERASLRALGIVLLAVSAALKYFPLAAVILLLDARTRREFLGWGLLYGLVWVLAWPSLEAGLRNAVSHTPAPSWLYAFGATVIFRNADIVAPAGWLLAGFLVYTGMVAWPAIRAANPTQADGPARDQEREFACGAVMVVGCFLHSSSYLYKMVFALWLLPWLWRATLVEKEERWRKTTRGLLLAVLWFEGGSALVVNLLYLSSAFSAVVANNLHTMTQFVSQLFTWALVLCLWRGLLRYMIKQVRFLGSPVPDHPRKR
jgi:hypothetical protein